LSHNPGKSQRLQPLPAFGHWNNNLFAGLQAGYFSIVIGNNLSRIAAIGCGQTLGRIAGLDRIDDTVGRRITSLRPAGKVVLLILFDQIMLFEVTPN